MNLQSKCSQKKNVMYSFLAWTSLRKYEGNGPPWLNYLSLTTNFNKNACFIMQLYLFKGSVWWFSRLKGNCGYLWLPNVVHKRKKKIKSDLFCSQKTGHVCVRVHVTFYRKTIITVVHIVGEKILNDKLKIIMILP